MTERRDGTGPNERLRDYRFADLEKWMLAHVQSEADNANTWTAWVLLRMFVILASEPNSESLSYAINDLIDVLEEWRGDLSTRPPSLVRARANLERTTWARAELERILRDVRENGQSHMPRVVVSGEAIEPPRVQADIVVAFKTYEEFLRDNPVIGELTEEGLLASTDEYLDEEFDPLERWISDEVWLAASDSSPDEEPWGDVLRNTAEHEVVVPPEASIAAVLPPLEDGTEYRA